MIVPSLIAAIYGFIKFGINGLFVVLFLFLYQVLDGLLTFVTLLFSSLDVGAYAFNAVALWLGLPPVALYVVNQLDLPQCALLVSGAMTLRMVMNTLPSWLTRV